ncbi:MSHA biogenesis protein MshP [Vibrio sp. CAIM 722]|uniref:MSHA biogenesis protein MshP n=1 Tax=Vibrio eleionomae TaxID=2653505 RepID=A0A7X4RTY2_9VIBR|nr:MSHA biogenesis protein MshP [Vibrio eleionomae]MZI92725.1 MSHA biogenesis protein MshP [Vibrio eleionomae]
MSPKIKKQSGNLYIVAIFVIIVMGLLASALTRMEWSNQDSISRELIGNKAWYAAHSINERALTTMYPLNTSSDVASACSTWNANSSAGADVMASIPNCQWTSTCANEGTLSINSTTYYRIETTVICGSGNFQVQRVQDVWIKE